ncbi:hypothetical protein [Actinokineospora sp. HUAS TT18]|uniref:hypothetical protein n=1 Tax=Actinokineospora sp. HUAS TT18 TaxID=3447451 RepID=UPI003F525B6F
MVKIESVMDGATARDRADWDRVSHVYGQCVSAISDDVPYLPPVLAGFLAEALARVSSNYYDSEDQFVQDAFEVFHEWNSADESDTLVELYSDSRFLGLTEYMANHSGRRRPTPFEAVVETARRLRDLNSLERKLGEVTIGALLGGSVSYGRFYNVAGAGYKKPSDIDLLLVIEEFDDIRAICTALGTVENIAISGVADLSARAETFITRNVPDDVGPVLFSGKVHAWADIPDPIFGNASIDGHYDISFHIASRDVMDELIFRKQPRIDLTSLGRTRMVSDFRETRASREDHQRSFSGRNLRLALETTEVEESIVRSSHLYYIDDDERFYPGMFQNLILPQFDVRWGTRHLRRAVEAFRWKMVERLRFERQARPHEFLRLSLAHTRSEVFAPHTIRSVDGSTLLS